MYNKNIDEYKLLVLFYLDIIRNWISKLKYIFITYENKLDGKFKLELLAFISSHVLF